MKVEVGVEVEDTSRRDFTRDNRGLWWTTRRFQNGNGAGARYGPFFSESSARENAQELAEAEARIRSRSRSNG